MSNGAGEEFILMMRCFRRKRLHLILAVRACSGIDLLVQFDMKLKHVHTQSTVTPELGRTYALSQNSVDSHEWLVGGKEYSTDKGFIKSIRIVYK